MNFNFTIDLIYKQCAERISKRIDEKGLSHRAIYKSESKIIGRIRRCEIDEKRNKYLIRYSVLVEIKEKLGYSCHQDILWGTHDEIEENLILIFQSLMFDLVSSTSPYKDIINEILCAYIPYARYLGYYHILFEQNPPNKQITDLYGVDLYNAYETIDSYTDAAIYFLFIRCKDDFMNSYFRFIDKQDTFRRWYYKLEEWVNDDLLKVLNIYKPSKNDFGRRISDLIKYDYSYIPYLGNDKYSETMKNIISATEKYITELEKIQVNHFKNSKDIIL